MEKDYETYKRKDVSYIDFHVNGMPLKHFKRFKEYAKDYRDNYSMVIQVLMDKEEDFEFIKDKFYKGDE